MICMEAHRRIMRSIPPREFPIDRNANTKRGHGFHEHLPNKASRKRYSGRKKGLIPPVDYRPIDEALKVLQ